VTHRACFLVVSLVIGLTMSIVRPGQAADKIRILSPTWSGYAPIFVAGDLGYFKQLGLDVDLKFEDERANAMAAMARGDIEMDLLTAGEFQGRPRDENTPGVIIGTIDQSVGGDGVIAAGDIKTIADLKGKTLAAEPNIPGRLLLQLELKKAGLSLRDIMLKDIATADTVAIFADPSIAAVATFQPFLSQALKLDVARNPTELISSANYPGYIVDVVIVRQDDLKANPDKYRRLLIGMFKAIEYFKTNKADFIKLAAPHYTLSMADFAASIDGSLTYTGYAETGAAIGKPGAPGSLYGTFDTLMSLNIENGAADHRLSAEREIDSSVMAKIGPGDLK